MLQVDHSEEFKRPNVNQTNYSTSVNTSHQSPPAHLYQPSYVSDQSIPQKSPPPYSRHLNMLMNRPYASESTSIQYSQYHSLLSQVKL